MFWFFFTAVGFKNTLKAYQNLPKEIEVGGWV
jgi:hypothetical protein